MPGLLDRLLGRSKDAVPGWIDIDTLRQRQDAGEPVLLIDVRGVDEFDAPPGHLPGAVNIPLPELQGRMADVTAQSRPICGLQDRSPLGQGSRNLTGSRSAGCRSAARRHRRLASARIAAGLTSAALLLQAQPAGEQFAVVLQNPIRRGRDQMRIDLLDVA